MRTDNLFCPFCGSTDLLKHEGPDTVTMRCQSCDASAKAGMWNKRVPHPDTLECEVCRLRWEKRHKKDACPVCANQRAANKDIIKALKDGRKEGLANAQNKRAARLVVSSVPKSLKTKEFESAWAEWVPYRMKLKKLKDPVSTFGKQLSFLERYMPSEAAEILNASIRNGWQGLFPQNNANHRNTYADNPRNRGQNIKSSDAVAYADVSRKLKS